MLILIIKDKFKFTQKPQYYCSLHENDEVKYYCKQDDLFLCAFCVLGHKNHSDSI